MSRSDLANCVNGLQFASLFYSSEYPAKDGDYHPVTEKLLNHAQGKKKARDFAQLLSIPRCKVDHYNRNNLSKLKGGEVKVGFFQCFS